MRPEFMNHYEEHPIEDHDRQGSGIEPSVADVASVDQAVAFVREVRHVIREHQKVCDLPLCIGARAQCMVINNTWPSLALLFAAFWSDSDNGYRMAP